MQGIVFQGVFFVVFFFKEKVNLIEESLLQAIEDQVQLKFGSKGQCVVDDNMCVVCCGFDEVGEVMDKVVGVGYDVKVNVVKLILFFVMFKDMLQSKFRLSDIYCFWEQMGSFYQQGSGNDNFIDLFIGLSVMFVAFFLFCDMIGICFNYLEWIVENCIVCGKCYIICLDMVLLGLVFKLFDVFDIVVQCVKNNYGKFNYLLKVVCQMELEICVLFNEGDDWVKVNIMI